MVWCVLDVTPQFAFPGFSGASSGVLSLDLRVGMFESNFLCEFLFWRDSFFRCSGRVGENKRGVERVLVGEE